jgi:hypothetical protein
MVASGLLLLSAICINHCNNSSIEVTNNKINHRVRMYKQNNFTDLFDSCAAHK